MLSSPQDAPRSADAGLPGEVPSGPAGETTRRIELTLQKPWFALYARIKPTVVIAGRGQPAQWGPGTWQVPSDRSVVIGVFLFNRMWRFGQAEFALEPHDAPSVLYRAPALPFLPGRIEIGADPDAAG